MSKVILDISMSLDGLIAQPDDDPGPIQEYLFSGGTEHDGMFRTSGATTGVFREFVDAAGALVTGRRTYDLTSVRGSQLAPRQELITAFSRFGDRTAAGRTSANTSPGAYRARTRRLNSRKAHARDRCQSRNASSSGESSLGSTRSPLARETAIVARICAR